MFFFILYIDQGWKLINSYQFSDEGFETTSISGRNVYESVRLNHTTSVLEGLQSQLKLREGMFVHKFIYNRSIRERLTCLHRHLFQF